MSPRALITCIALLAGSGCVSLPTGTFGDRSFMGPKKAYEISYATADGHHDLLPGWRVDNFVYAKGRPDASKDVDSLKRGLAWSATDGRKLRVYELPSDLDLTHRESGAFIWVSALPKDDETRGRRLDVIAEDWANAFGGSHTARAFGGPGKRITTKIIKSEDTEVDGLPAYRVVFDVINLDQREVDADSARKRVAGVFLGPSIKKTLQWDTRFFEAPACLFFGYANDKDEFDELEPDFEGLLKRVRVTSVTAPRQPSVALPANQ